MENDIYFLKEAIKEAKKAFDKNEVPVGCVIVIDDKIIARAHNLRETKKSALGHAEILAIEKASKKLERWILDDATLYVTLEPCTMCTGAIFQSRIKRVVFAANEPKFGALGSVIDLSKVEKFNHKIDVSQGLLEEEVSQLMKNFFKKLRQKN